LSGASSCTAVPAPSARAASTTAGSTSYSTSMRSAASRACVGVSATTSATGSPTWRTLPCASTGCGGSFIGLPSLLWISQPQGRPPTLASARSAPVKTATTPGAASAGAVSIAFTSRACACGERRKTP
jgi:hypothetical protein